MSKKKHQEVSKILERWRPRLLLNEWHLDVLYTDEAHCDEPGDPSKFEFKVAVKDRDGVIQNFTVTAEADVNFYARETATEDNNA